MARRTAVSVAQPVYRGRMKLQFLVICVAACGGPKGPVTNTGVGIGNKSVYAPVFVKGASWTFTAETKTTPPMDMGPPSAEKKPNITCTVDDVHEMPAKGGGAVSMATVSCTDGKDTAATGNQPPAGLYAANSSGLYWFDASDPKAHDKATMLDPRTLLIPAGTPVARKQEGKSADEIESWVYETKQEGDAWCGYYSSAAGDEGGFGFCFDAKGMVKANTFQAGATTYETFYKRP